MPSAIVTSTYRYKRPPRKRKVAPLEGPAIVGKRAPSSQHASAPQPPAKDRRPAIVTAAMRGRRPQPETADPREVRM